MVLLTGEAGIGKSRITRVAIDTIASEPHFRINYQCSPYHSDSALYPAIQQLSRAADFVPGDDSDCKLDKLEALLGRTIADEYNEAVSRGESFESSDYERLGRSFEWQGDAYSAVKYFELAACSFATLSSVVLGLPSDLRCR